MVGCFTKHPIHLFSLVGNGVPGGSDVFWSISWKKKRCDAKMFKKGGVQGSKVLPQDGWFIMEKPIKMGDLGVPPFKETPTYIYIYIYIQIYIYIHISVHICFSLSIWYSLVPKIMGDPKMDDFDTKVWSHVFCGSKVVNLISTPWRWWNVNATWNPLQ